MRIAAIDIGTNTILLLIADVDADGCVAVIRDEHSIARLGKGVDRQRRIMPEAERRVVEILRSHLAIAAAEGVQRVIAVGTSALRDAANRDDVLRVIRDQLGLEISVVSGEDEALLTFRGTLSGLSLPPDAKVAVLDIGGGSTEVTFGTPQAIASHSSLDIGAVRLTERWWDGYPPSAEALARAREDLDASLQQIRSEGSAACWFGVAGTPTTLAAIGLGLPTFDRKAVDGHVLTRAFVERTVEALCTLPLPQLQSHPQIHPQRADIIVAGAMILAAVLRRYAIDEITVSARGLRYGLALEAVK